MMFAMAIEKSLRYTQLPIFLFSHRAFVLGIFNIYYG